MNNKILYSPLSFRQFIRRIGLLLSLFIVTVLTLPSAQAEEAPPELVTRWQANNTPFGISVNANAHIYVANVGSHLIQKFDDTGNLLRQWGRQPYGSSGSAEGEFNQPNGIAVDGAGNVYVADSQNHRIQKFTSDGTFLMQWGTQGAAEGQFQSPCGIGVDADGNVYVGDSNNHRIQKFTNNGNFLAQWPTYIFFSETGSSVPSLPYDVKVDADGAVYVASYYGVEKFDSAGNRLTQWYSTNQQCNDTTRAVAVDADGNVYVSLECTHRIVKLTSTGIFLSSWEIPPLDNEIIITPRGMVIDTENQLYVTDNSHRVNKFAYAAPAAPTNLSAVAVSPTGIDLSWTDNSDNETGFIIERCKDQDCTNFSEIAAVAANLSSYSDINLSSDTLYAYRVLAINNGVKSDYSNIIRVRTLANLLPAAPENLTATPLSNTEIRLNWTDKSTNETAFLVERCQVDCGNESSFSVIASVPADMTTFSDSGLTADTAYIYRVRASNLDANSAYSNTATATTLSLVITPPASPTNFNATLNATAFYVNLSWTDASNNEDGFKIVRDMKVNPNTCKKVICKIIPTRTIIDVAANVENYADVNITTNTEYTYGVYAYNSAGDSVMSNTVTVKIPPLRFTPRN